MQTRKCRWGVLTNYNVFLVVVCRGKNKYDILPPITRRGEIHRHVQEMDGITDNMKQILSTPVGIMLALSVLPEEELNMRTEEVEERIMVSQPTYPFVLPDTNKQGAQSNESSSNTSASASPSRAVNPPRAYGLRSRTNHSTPQRPNQLSSIEVLPSPTMSTCIFPPSPVPKMFLHEVSSDMGSC